MDDYLLNETIVPDSCQRTGNIAEKFNVSWSIIHQNLKEIGKTDKREFGFHMRSFVRAEHNVLPSTTLFYPWITAFHFWGVLFQVMKSRFCITTESETGNGYHVMRDQYKDQNQNSIHKKSCSLLGVTWKLLSIKSNRNMEGRYFNADVCFYQLDHVDLVSRRRC